MKILTWDEFLHCDSLKPYSNAAITIGVFDGVHRGHAALLEATSTHANFQNNEQAIVFTFRFSPKKHTKTPEHRNLQTIEQRLHHISRFGITTAVLIDFTPEFGKLSGYHFLSLILARIHLSYIALGDDFKMGRNGTCSSSAIVEYLQFASPQTVAEIFSTVEFNNIRISSSLLRSTLLQGDLPLYEKLSGHPHELSKKNDNWQHDDEELLLPPAGKYMATALDADRNIIWANQEIDLDAKGVPNGGSINSAFTLQLQSKRNETHK